MITCVWRSPTAIALIASSLLACGGDEAGSQQLHTRDNSEVRAAWVRVEVTDANAWLDEDPRNDKYAKMAPTPFTFFRGTNHLYYADFAGDDRLEAYGGATTWIQGDLHVGNIGVFEDDRAQIVFDLNDFDEAVVADYQIDLWRCATSLVLVAQENELSKKDARAGVEAFVESYLDTVEDYRGNDDELDAIMDETSSRGQLSALLAEVALEESRAKMLDKWTVVTEAGERVMNVAYKKLEALDAGQEAGLSDAISSHYRNTLSGKLDWDADYFRVKSIAARLDAGVGSYGSQRFYALIEGPTMSLDDDIILDVKESLAPTALSYLDVDYPFDNHAERAALGQKAMLTNVDDHLGWLTFDNQDYLVRERSPFKEDFATDELLDRDSLVEQASQWGTVVATAHARADEDFDDRYVDHSFEKRIHEVADHNHDEIRELVWGVAAGYADQVTFDHQAFLVLVDD